MNNYLNIYLIDSKTKERKRLYSCSCSSGLCRAFNENLNIACYGEREDVTELRVEDFLKVINDLHSQIDRDKKRLWECEKYAASNSGLIEEILPLKEGIAEMEGTLRDVDFLKDIFLDSTSGYTDFEGICVNIS